MSAHGICEICGKSCDVSPCSLKCANRRIVALNKRIADLRDKLRKMVEYAASLGERINRQTKEIMLQKAQFARRIEGDLKIRDAVMLERDEAIAQRDLLKEAAKTLLENLERTNFVPPCQDGKTELMASIEALRNALQNKKNLKLKEVEK